MGGDVVNTADLVERALAGQPRAVAQLISLVENASSPRSRPAVELREVAAALAPSTGKARVIGLTGPPGVGKSTSTSALISALRERGQRVGVLAIDPSSPFSGGALLGDRIRMAQHATDAGVFIRSMATRGHLGGLAWATPQALRVLDAAGFDVVLIETVGVGQSEVDIVSLADTTVVLLAPGMGDDVQAAKAGILEVADVLVVNKADHADAERTVLDLRRMMAHARTEGTGPGWRPPILRTVASTGEGIDSVVAALWAHHDWLDQHQELTRRRARRARREIEAIAMESMRAELGELHGEEATRLAELVAGGELDPFTAAERLLKDVRRTR